MNLKLCFYQIVNLKQGVLLEIWFLGWCSERFAPIPGVEQFHKNPVETPIKSLLAVRCNNSSRPNTSAPVCPHQVRRRCRAHIQPRHGLPHRSSRAQSKQLAPERRRHRPLPEAGAEPESDQRQSLQTQGEDEGRRKTGDGQREGLGRAASDDCSVGRWKRSLDRHNSYEECKRSRRRRRQMG